MRFRVKMTAGFQVRRPTVGLVANGRIVEASRPPVGWLIDMTRFEKFVDRGLRGQSFGQSIETFFLGFEIADIDAWGDVFSKTTKYVSYRPQMKGVVSVAQRDYRDVKGLGPGQQFERLTEAVGRAILRVGTMKRKPRDFDYERMATRVGRLFQTCSLEEVDAVGNACRRA